MNEQEREHRLAVALALRQIADNICDNDDWPVADYPRIHVSADRVDQGGTDAVQRAAAAMGVQPVWEAGGNHYTAETQVGPVKYSVTAIKTAHMDEYAAAQKVADEWIQQQRTTDT